MACMGLMNTKVEEEIKYFKEMIEEARSQGLENVAKLFAEQLELVLAMNRFDKGELV